MRAPGEIARALELKAGEGVVMIRRQLQFGSVPLVLDEIWLPGTRFKGLTAERLNAYSGPLYGLLEAEFGTRMIHASERVRAVAAEAQQSEWLDVRPGEPLLLAERISTTYTGRPVEVRRGWYVTRGHHYFNELN
jgi:GntR family transcriptional regulator